MIDQDGVAETSDLAAEEAGEQEDAAAQEVEATYQSMDELLEQEAGFRKLQVGDIVSGTVERLDEHGALVNVGAKSEGLIPPEELGRDADLRVGDEVVVAVVEDGAKDGNILLSKKKADYEKAWSDIIKAYDDVETVSAMVIDRVKGGLVVDLGMRGFLPASHVATRNVNALDRFVGQSVRLKVIEVDRKRKRVVVSQKMVLDEERKARREQTIASIEEGQIRRGVVRRVTDYGAFVDLGGIDGLLHVTEMSWGRVSHPSDLVKPGQRIDVMVLRYDPQNEKISLGLKQILPDPWQHIESLYEVGEEVEGTVTRLVPFGAFVALDHGIEGIIPNPELADQRVKKPGDVVALNQRVRVRIVNIRAAERRMTLSLRQVAQPQEAAEVAAYARSAPAGSMTIGEMLGDVFAAEEEAETPPQEIAGAEEEAETPSQEIAAAEEEAETPSQEIAAAEEEAETPPQEIAGADAEARTEAEDAAGGQDEDA